MRILQWPVSSSESGPLSSVSCALSSLHSAWPINACSVHVAKSKKDRISGLERSPWAGRLPGKGVPSDKWGRLAAGGEEGGVEGAGVKTHVAGQH